MRSMPLFFTLKVQFNEKDSHRKYGLPEIWGGGSFDPQLAAGGETTRMAL